MLRMLFDQTQITSIFLHVLCSINCIYIYFLDLQVADIGLDERITILEDTVGSGGSDNSTHMFIYY